MTEATENTEAAEAPETSFDDWCDDEPALAEVAEEPAKEPSKEEEQEDAPEAPTEAATEGKKPKDVPYERFKEVNDEKKEERTARLAAEARIAALEAQVSNLADVKSLLEPKKSPPTIDDELKKYGIDPAQFAEVTDEYGNVEMSVTAQKKLALNEAKTTVTINQMQTQNTLSRTVSDIDAAVYHLKQSEQPELAEMLTNGVTLLVSNQSFIMQENNPQLTEAQADAAAYDAIMYELAQRSQKQGKSVALIAAEMSDKLAKRLNVPLVKQKEAPKEVDSGKINLHNREESKARAGKPAIQTAPKGAVKVDESTAKLFSSFCD